MDILSYRYTVAWSAADGVFVVGFTAGWFTAFLVSFFLATWLLVVKAKGNLSQTTDFLDHI